MRNKVLIFGGKGWLANEFAAFYTGDVATVTDVNILDIDAVRNALRVVKPDVVINAAGKTGRPNIDWCEENEENRKLTQYVNDYAVAILREVVCPYAKLVHLSSGCLWSADGISRITEEKQPEPPSWYSETKAAGDKRLEGTDALVLRIRMPFDGSWNDRCLLAKLARYKKLISYFNSLTYVPDLLVATQELVKKDLSGIFNVVNFGDPVDAEFIMNLYEIWVDSGHEYEIVPTEQLVKEGVMKVGRSNCVLSTKKLQFAGVTMGDTKERVLEALQKMGKSRGS